MVSHKPSNSVFPEAGDYCRFWFEPAMKKAAIDDYTWHCNRHTSAHGWQWRGPRSRRFKP